MENMERIGHYIKDNNSLVFMVKNANTCSENSENYPTKDLEKIFEKYNEVYKKPGFKELLLVPIRSQVDLSFDSLKTDFRVSSSQKLFPN